MNNTQLNREEANSNKIWVQYSVAQKGDFIENTVTSVYSCKHSPLSKSQKKSRESDPFEKRFPNTAEIQ